MVHKLKKIRFSELSKRHRRASLGSAIFLGMIIVAGVLLDQATKIQSDRHLKVWESEDRLRSYRGNLHQLIEWGEVAQAKTTGPYFVLNLSYVRNPGAAWGVFANLPDHIRVPFFNIITALCILFIVLFLYFTPRSQRMIKLSLGLLFAGAVGNMIDRFRLNYVIDWIDVRWNIGGWYYAFPNFNVADICISIGAFLIVLDGMIAMIHEYQVPKPAASSD